MKIINFPKNKHKESSKNNKLQVAINFLKMFINNDIEFHIIINKKDALELFEDTGDFKDYFIISSNYESSKRLIINNSNSNIYEIQGDELETML